MSNDEQGPIKDDQSLSIDDAAKRLGMSPATIRRRIKNRKLAAFQRPTERGFEWRVLPDQPVENLDHNDDQPVHIVAQEVSIDVQNDDQPLENDDQAVLKALEMLDEERRKVDQLQDQLREASTVAAHWQARAVTAEQTVQRLLPAPKDGPEPPAQPEAVKSWWKRLFG